MKGIYCMEKGVSFKFGSFKPRSNELVQQCCTMLDENFKAHFYCDFKRDFLLLMDVNEWISYECSDEGTSVNSI